MVVILGQNRTEILFGCPLCPLNATTAKNLLLLTMCGAADVDLLSLGRLASVELLGAAAHARAVAVHPAVVLGGGKVAVLLVAVAPEIIG